MSTRFATLAHAVEISGVGLHCGAHCCVRLVPREEVGIVLARVDLPDAPEIWAVWKRIASTHHATVIENNGAQISTPEHLLAALWSLGITHCRIELDGGEIPILDGSALPWVELIQSAGRVELDGQRPEYSLCAPVAVYAREGAVIGLPHDNLRVTVDVEYGLEYLAPQVFGAEITPQSFAMQLAPARTFTLKSWIEPLRAKNLIRGGSTDNALVLSQVAPSSILRFETELARHKALDLLGDVALLFGENGGVLNAHLIAIRAGHELHRLWMEEAARSQVLRL